MGIHHTAFASRDIDATHAFYTDVMGFELVKVEVASTPKGGWAKHLFYDTGDAGSVPERSGGMVAFWDLHDDTLPADFSPAISTGLGLPEWVNHLSFDAHDVDGLEAIKQRWLDMGIGVAEIDHGWCSSIYTMDPNGILVEFCATTKPMTDADREEARRLLADPNPPVGTPPPTKFHQPKTASSAT